MRTMTLKDFVAENKNLNAARTYRGMRNSWRSGIELGGRVLIFTVA